MSFLFRLLFLQPLRSAYILETVNLCQNGRGHVPGIEKAPGGVSRGAYMGMLYSIFMIPFTFDYDCSFPILSEMDCRF